MARTLGLPALLGPPGRHRDLAMALVISRVVRPGSKLSTLTWWADATLGADLGVAGASTDDIYAAMDWLAGRQDAIEAELARRHLGPQPNPSRMALSGLSSSWLEGSHCPLAARGYSRDGKKGKLQIEYGLLTDPEGRPAAVRVFPGNTGGDGGPAGEPPCPVADGRVAGEPGAQRERGVGLDADRQRDGRVDVQGVPDAGQRPDLTEPGHLPDAHPAGPHRHSGGRGQDQQWPRACGPAASRDRYGPVRTRIRRWSGRGQGEDRGRARPVRIAGGVNLLPASFDWLAVAGSVVVA